MRWLPEYAEKVTAIRSKVWDLWPVIRESIYHPAFGGSFSLKSVLPAMVPQISYEHMEVGDGIAAGIAWRKMIDPATGEDEKTQLKHALLEYCGQDTLALVKLLEKIRLGAVS